MSFVVLFIAITLIIILADMVMLRRVIQPVFAKHIGHLLYEGSYRLVPAGLFYLVYMFGVMWFAAVPALQAGDPGFALVNGAILGLVAYGTYELSSWAVMQDWHPQMVAVDLAWGTAITALSAWGGVWVTLALMG